MVLHAPASPTTKIVNCPDPGPDLSRALPHYHALDSVRAMAMLLGVVYHSLLFRMMVGGPPPGSIEMSTAAHSFEQWLHGFRMPVFFLISGFFARMMLEKYSIRDYMKRRVKRIGVPLFVGLFTFVPAYLLTQNLVSHWSGAGPMGPPPGSEAGLLRGSSDAFGPRRDVPGGTRGSSPRFGARPHDAGPPGGTAFGPMGPPFSPPRNEIADLLFGKSARLFQLHHLWFLWYLLLFAVVAPAVAGIFSRVLPTSALDSAGRAAIRSGFAPVLLGLIITPALLLASPRGWSLGLCPAIFRSFPDFLLHFDRDMPFYFLFFLAGWWLHRDRVALPILSRIWAVYLLVGLVAFWAASALGVVYGHQTTLQNYALIRVAGAMLYCVASASTSFGFIGFFQRYFDRQSRAWRYLADTALWVYLIHQPLVLVGLAIFSPLQLSWWLQTLLVSLLSVLSALLLYELAVRPTFLVQLFGPASHRPSSHRSPRRAELTGSSHP